MRDVICKVCGKTFKSNNSKACYCSPECKVTGNRRTRLKWEDQNPNYAHENYMKRKKEDNMNGLEALKQERAKLTEKIRKYENSMVYTSKTKLRKGGSSRYPNYVISVWGVRKYGDKMQWRPILTARKPNEAIKLLDEYIKELTELRNDAAEMFKTLGEL